MPLIPERFPRTTTAYVLATVAIALLAVLFSADVVRWLSYTLAGVAFWSFFIGFGGLIHCAYLRRR